MWIIRICITKQIWTAMTLVMNICDLLWQAGEHVTWTSVSFHIELESTIKATISSSMCQGHNWITQIDKVWLSSFLIGHTDSSYCTGKMRHLYLAPSSMICRSRSHMLHEYLFDFHEIGYWCYIKAKFFHVSITTGGKKN